MEESAVQVVDAELELSAICLHCEGRITMNKLNRRSMLIVMTISEIK